MCFDIKGLVKSRSIRW